MGNTTRIDAVQYETPDGGTVTVTFDSPEWVVDDNGTEHRFASVPQWMGYVRETYAWPLPSKVA